MIFVKQLHFKLNEYSVWYDYISHSEFNHAKRINFVLTVHIMQMNTRPFSQVCYGIHEHNFHSG